MSQHQHPTRRAFIGTTAAASTLATRTGRAATLAVNGGTPVRTTPFNPWPEVFGDSEKQILDVLHSGEWFRKKWNKRDAHRVDQFEQEYAAACGVKFTLATSCGTTALQCALEAADVQPGDEVLLSCYTFCATANSIFEQKALAVFVDTEPDTFQIDPARIEEKITPRTRAIIPVHYGGYPCDMDAVNAIAKRHNLIVIEDACQSHLSKYRGKSCGALGDMGCFSFQVSKPLPAGEGGALTTNNETFHDAARWYHDTGINRKQPAGHSVHGMNYRMTEWQATILLEALKGLDERVQHVHDNVQYFNKLVSDVPGFAPAKFVDGGERGTHYVYLARYYSEKFKGLPRDAFMRAMKAEGIPVGGGYDKPLSEEGLVEHTLNSRGFQRIYSPKELNQYRKTLDCPVTREICGSSVSLKHWLFMGSRKDVAQIAEAVHKVYESADSIG
jgi:perosamine synthetase